MKSLAVLISKSYNVKVKRKGVPRQTLVAQGVPGRLRPRIFLTFRHYNGGRSSAKRTGRLYPRRNTWYSLSEAESTSGHVVLSGVPRKKIPSDTTGNRSRDRPTRIAVPWPLRNPVSVGLKKCIFYKLQSSMFFSINQTPELFHLPCKTEHKADQTIWGFSWLLLPLQGKYLDRPVSIHCKYFPPSP
jgi:hypothetical protein